MSNFTDRMIRAAKLDVNLYEEVEADKGALSQAMGVVVLSGVAAGVGSIGSAGIAGIFTGTITALIGWIIQMITLMISFSIFGGFDKLAQ